VRDSPFQQYEAAANDCNLVMASQGWVYRPAVPAEADNEASCAWALSLVVGASLVMRPGVELRHGCAWVVSRVPMQGCRQPVGAVVTHGIANVQVLVAQQVL